MNVEETYKKIIYDWVAKYFGRNEADDPSWNIDALAKELASHFLEMYWAKELDDIKEDVKAIAESDNYSLTDKQLQNVAEAIQGSDYYGTKLNPNEVEYFLENELGE